MIELKQHNIKPYVELCVELQKSNKCAYVSATGTGKSYVIGKYIEDFMRFEDCVIVVPSRAIANNWKRLLPEVEVFTYQGTILLDSIIDIIKNKKLLVLDEFHHLGAEQWGKPFFELLDIYVGKIIGLSATPIRYLDNERDMSDEYFDGHVVTGVDLVEAINQSILPSFEYITAIYNLPKEIKKLNIEHNEQTEELFAQLDILNSQNSFENILKKHLPKCDDYKIVVFVDSHNKMREIKTLCESVLQVDNSFELSFKQTFKVYNENYEGFINSTGLSLIYCVNMLNEGVHIDGVNCVIMFRKTRSPQIYLQQLGRALSTNLIHKPLIFDFVANHSNLQTYVKMQENTVERLNSGIKNPKKQIVISDYALEFKVLAQKLHDLSTIKWLPEEVDIIHRYYGKANWIETVMNLLPHRSRDAILCKARSVGLFYRRRINYPETLESDIQLYYNSSEGLDKLCNLYPELKRAQITAFANRLGFSIRHCPNPWTQEELDYLLENKDLSIKELSEHLNRPHQVVGNKLRVLGIYNKRYFRWTEDELKIIEDNYSLPNDDLVKLLPNRPRSQILKRALEFRDREENFWTPDRLTIFRELYESGGYKAVKSYDDFKDLKTNTIAGVAQRHGFKSKNKNPQTSWSLAEILICKEFVESNSTQPVMQFARETFPDRTPASTKDIIRRIKNGTINYSIYS